MCRHNSLCSVQLSFVLFYPDPNIEISGMFHSLKKLAVQPFILHVLQVVSSARYAMLFVCAEVQVNAGEPNIHCLQGKVA